jgi:anti-anti-sigma factor
MSVERCYEGTSPEILTIGTYRDRHEHIIEVAGELDLSGVTRFSEACASALESDVRGIVLDLRNLEFLDSTGVHAILKAQRSASEQGRSFVIVRGPRQVQRIFEISGVLDRLIFADA